MSRCANCFLQGRQAEQRVGHRCVDVDPCPRCGGPMTLLVVEVYAEGGSLREREPCQQCRSHQLQGEADEVGR